MAPSSTSSPHSCTGSCTNRSSDYTPWTDHKSWYDAYCNAIKQTVSSNIFYFAVLILQHLFQKNTRKGATRWPKISPVQEEIYKTGALWKIQANCYPNYKPWIHLIFTIPRRQYSGHYIFFLSRCFYNKIMYNTEDRSWYKQIHQTFLQYSK